MMTPLYPCGHNTPQKAKERRGRNPQAHAVLCRMLSDGLIEQESDGQNFRITAKGSDIANKFREIA